MAYLCIALTVLLTAYGQLVLKWQSSLRMVGADPGRALPYILAMLFNPWVISAFLAAFGASLCWMLAVARLELSRAYPFMALNFVLVGIMAIPLFGETYNLPKLAGLALIVLGLVVSNQG